MFLVKFAAVALGLMMIFLTSNATATWSPGGMVVNLGDLNFTSSPGFKEGNPIESYPTIPLLVNNSLMNDTSMNSTSTINSTEIVSSSLIASDGLEPLDLSGYAHDRVNKNLTGYKNIMYPISGSRGTTTSTAGGASGCGCG